MKTKLPDLVVMALNKWGHNSQIDKLEEELIEALHAVRVYRNTRSRRNLVAMFDELADVTITKGSVQLHNLKLYEKCLERKLNKLRGYLND